ncbi:acyltransferase [Microbacterium sp. JC 701]|uniref:acyltransferase family protein n=1 Tax=Microbacterium sp. JC 701 TaxID=2897389 RepID=UPI001E3F4D7F|nr:acyltransferase [Microbacterium sp. JC 701]MCD2170205.1 acyltransferase [Microbacterium sp. JC 701]
MDVLRGTAIGLVIINHSILFAGQQGDLPEPIEAFNSVFAPVRMPLMVFLSGLLVAPSLRKGWRQYTVGKLRRILWPYLVWSVIVVGIDSATDLATGGGVPWGDWLRVLYSPLAHLWFLYYLLAYYAIALITRKMNALVVATVALGACVFAPDDSWSRFLLLLAAFMAGKWVSDRPQRLEAAIAHPIVVILASAVFAVGAAVAVAGVDLRYEAVSAPLVAGGVIAAIAASQRIQHARALRPVRFVGRFSLVFYLSHWYGVIVAVQLADRVIGNPLATFAAGVLGGTAAGVALAWVVRLVPPVNALFEFPRRAALRRNNVNADRV